MVKFCILDSSTCLSALKQPSKVPYKKCSTFLYVACKMYVACIFIYMYKNVLHFYDPSKQTTSIK